LRLVYDLRREDVSAWLAFGKRGLKSQLREAGKRAVRFAVILGEDELAVGTAMVRDMQAGEQVSVELSGLVEWLKARAWSKEIRTS
jgi:histidyl-tRNA synthetase